MATGSGNNSLDQLTNVYKHVVDDVIRGVREEFLNEAVDLEVLEDLKRIWLNKLSMSGAVNRPAQPDPPPKPASTDKSSSKQQAQNTSTSKSPNPMLPPPLVPVQQSVSDPSFPQPPSLIPSRDSTHTERDSVTVIHHAPPRSQATPPAITAAHSSTPSQASIMIHPSMMTGIGGESGTTPTSQTLPTTLLQPSVQLSAFQQGMVPIQTPQGTVLVPLSHLMAFNQKASTASQGSKSTNDRDVHQIDGYPPSPGKSSLLSSGAVETPSCLSVSKRSTKPVSSALNSTKTKSPKTSLDGENTSSCVLGRSKRRVGDFPLPGDTVELICVSDHMTKRKRGGVIVQLDGGLGDSSSEDDSDLDEDSSEDDVGGTDEGVLDEEPLNSDDDVKDEQEDRDFDTNDTIVCLWEKVYRVRTKWKFLLKDGIMHLGGFDYVFQKGSGEADW